MRISRPYIPGSLVEPSTLSVPQGLNVSYSYPLAPSSYNFAASINPRMIYREGMSVVDETMASVVHEQLTVHHPMVASLDNSHHPQSVRPIPILPLTPQSHSSSSR